MNAAQANRVEDEKMERAARTMAYIGTLFLALDMLHLFSGGHWGALPRPDTAPWGFAVLGILYLIGAAGMLLAERERAAQAEGKGPCPKAAQARAAMLAFILQSLLLLTVTFLLIFTGYLGRVPAFCLLAVLTISVLSFVIARILYRKDNKEE